MAMKIIAIGLLIFNLIIGLPQESKAQSTFIDTTLFSRFFDSLPYTFHRNHYEYTSLSVPYKFMYSTDSAVLTRSFDPLGRVTDENLKLENGENYMRYFDKSGVCYKYRKLHETDCFYIYSDREPYRKMMDSSFTVVQNLLTAKFGNYFCKKYIRLSGLGWHTDKPYDNGGLIRQPFQKPSQITIQVDLFINDSTEIDLYEIALDSNLIPVDREYSESFLKILNSPKSSIIATVDFEKLNHQFDKKGYLFKSIEWDFDQNTFFANYYTKTYFYLVGLDTAWEYKKLTYDLNTKKTVIEKLLDYPSETIACGYYSPFQSEFKDTFQLEEGWRKIYLEEAIINIPKGWNLYTYSYSYGDRKTYITNGEDTLIYEVFYGILLNPENYIPKNDAVFLALKNRFPNEQLFGRDLDFILEQHENCYSLSMCTIEEGVGMNFSAISNSFQFKSMCPGHISLCLNILSSIRFSRY